MRVSVVVKCMFALALLSGCRGEKKKNLVINQIPKAAVEVDSTVYGVCGLGTAMNTLELITDNGDTVSCQLSAADSKGNVVGGLSVGDRMAVVGVTDKDEGFVASKVINITSLLGKWANIRESFEICDGGLVKSSVKEQTPRTEWKILNGKLLLSKDTFEISFIGPDSLHLKRAGVVYGYRRLPVGTLR